MTLSVLIPTFNEAERILPLVRHLRKYADQRLREIIVADAPASDDQTLSLLADEAKVHAFRTHATCRSQQLNQAAARARGDVLYFLHADARPPATYLNDLFSALYRGYDFGMFSYRFDSDHPLLRLNARMIKRDGPFTGGGDQSIFIYHSLFKLTGGYRNDLVIMEDFDYFWRLRRQGYRYTILDSEVLISARKYERNSYLKVSIVNGCTFYLFKMGFCQYKLKRFYKWALGGR